MEVNQNKSYLFCLRLYPNMPRLSSFLFAIIPQICPSLALFLHVADDLAATEKFIEAAQGDIGVIGVERMESVAHIAFEISFAVGNKDAELAE